MAKTVVIYAGGNTEYQFPFDYLRKEFVKVSLVAANGTSTDKVYGSDYTVTDRKITLKVASDATGEVRIWRSTATNPITVFSDASVLRARTLNALDTQLLHIAEENSDAISMYGMSFDNADNTWQGMGRIIKNVKNPLNPQDAVTLNYLDSVGVARAAQMEVLAAQITADKSNSEVAAAAALVSEKNAKTSETNAKVSEMASKTSETNAKTSEENSKTSETNAKVYMEACSNGAGYTKVEMDALLVNKVNTIDLGFSILYPNGGSLASPANVAVNSRYVCNNPFPGYHVLCIAEILYGGKWCIAGWEFSGSTAGYGTMASHLLPEDKIIVKTGNAGISSSGWAGGTGNDMILGDITTAQPCRVKVWKVGGKIG